GGGGSLVSRGQGGVFWPGRPWKDPPGSEGDRVLRNARAVLDLFTLDRAELGVVEAAALLNRHKSTVSRWMSAMEDAGFLERDRQTGRYRVSMRLAALGEVARR